MAVASAGVAFKGTKLSVGNAGGAGSYTDVLDVTGIRLSVAGDTIDITNTDSPTHATSLQMFREYVMGLMGPVTITVDGNALPHTQVLGKSPFDNQGVKKSFKITWSFGATYTFISDGFLTNAEMGGEVSGKLDCSYTIQLTGVPTWTTSA